MVERQLPKLHTGVRFPSPAPAHRLDKSQNDKAAWPALKARFTALFASRPREHWCELLEGTDVCFAPVLSIAEAVAHPHSVARMICGTDAANAVHAAAAPRFAAAD